jgi:hypothetical protein
MFPSSNLCHALFFSGFLQVFPPVDLIVRTEGENESPPQLITLAFQRILKLFNIRPKPEKKNERVFERRIG